MLNGCSLFIMNMFASVETHFNMDKGQVIGTATSGAVAGVSDLSGLLAGIIVITSLISIVLFIASVNPQLLMFIGQKIYELFTGRQSESTGDKQVDKAIYKAGYAYDPEQDIYYSTLNPWQRKFGYCRLYDEAMPALSMIVDCEPIYFKYNNKRWMIEMWKGQYGLCTGCEVGVYNAVGPNLDIPGFFRGTFYKSVKNADMLDISVTLRKNGVTLFTRQDKHWWLTGFVLGEFSNPSDLAADIQITLKDEEMRDAFLNGLNNAGYSRNEITVNGTTISLVYDVPRTNQPFSRTKVTDALIQAHNKNMCEQYQEITAPFKTSAEKIIAIQNEAPELYEYAVNMGKTRKVFEAFEIIKTYL